MICQGLFFGSSMELGEEGYAELHALLEAPWLVYRANHIKKCSFFKKVPPDSPK